MELDKQHIDNLNSIRTGTNGIAKRVNQLRSLNSKKLTNSQRDMICSDIINNFVIPMEGTMLGMYIQLNNLQEHFDGLLKEKK